MIRVYYTEHPNKLLKQKRQIVYRKLYGAIFLSRFNTDNCMLYQI